MSQGLWVLYRRGLKALAGLTKPDRSQGRDQTKPSTWSSRLGVGRLALGVELTSQPYKINYVTETTIMETTTRGPIADLSQPGSMATPAESLHQ